MLTVCMTPAFEVWVSYICDLYFARKSCKHS